MVYISKTVLIMKKTYINKFLPSLFSLAREKGLDVSTLKKRVGLQFSILSLQIISLFIGCSSTKEITAEYYWPLPPEIPRYKFLNIIQDEKYFSNSKTDILDVIAGEEKARVFLRPFGIVVDSDGNIYVSDTNLKRITVFDKAQKKVRTFGDTGPYKLHTPIDMVIVDNQLILVTDSFLRRIFVFDKAGNLLKLLGNESTFISPTGIAYDPKNKRIYVIDTNQHCVIVLDLEGQTLFQFGERGGANGQFNFPADIAIDEEKVYVVDAFNGRIQIFDLEGKYTSQFGKFGTSPGHFSRPKSIAVDSDKNIYVTDAAFDNFQVFNQNGEVLMFIGNPGSNIGEFQLPAGIFIDQNDFVYVVDQLNSRIQVFKYLKSNN